MVEVHVCVFPQLSVAVTVITLFPGVNDVPAAGDCVLVTVPPGQVVEAVEAVVKLGTTVEVEEVMV
jgi:hypothetical protein